MSPVLLDTVIAIVILLSVGVSFFRGFVKEMLTIVNLLGAALAAWFIGPHLIGSFKGWLGVGPNAKDIWGMIPPEVMATFLSYATAFFTVFLVLMLAGMSIAGTIKAMGLGPLDRIMGMVFGALRGFLLVFLIYLPFGYFMAPENYPQWAKDSISVAALDRAYVWTDEYLAAREEEQKAAVEAENSGQEDPDSVKSKLQKMKESLRYDRRKGYEEDPLAKPSEDILDDDRGRGR